MKLRHGRYSELTSLRRIETAFSKTLDTTELTALQELGRLLLSAILYGGLLRTEWLSPWLMAVQEGRVKTHDTTVWVDMEQLWTPTRKDGAKNTTTATMTRRWFADPVSHLLLMRWLNLPEGKRRITGNQSAPFELLKAFLQAAKVADADCPPKLTSLLDMAATRLGLAVTPYLVSYATGELNAVSVPAATWTRLCSNLAVPVTAPGSDENEADQIPGRAQKTPLQPVGVPLPLAEQQSLVQKLRRIFSTSKSRLHKMQQNQRNNTEAMDSNHGRGAPRKSPQYHAVVDFLDRNQPQLARLPLLLALWCKHTIETKGLAPRTMKQYLGAIANLLLLICGDTDILKWDEKEFTECYDRVLESTSSEKKNRVPLGLFHKYLVTFHSVTPMPKSYFARDASPAEVTVDANLVSQVEFDRIKLALGWADANRPRMATAALLVTILGFRCTLRRDEVQFLRVRDIKGRIKPELTLRNTPARSLKSPSATRRLPLHVLMTKEEVTLLMAWIDKIGDEQQEALLFSYLDRPTRKLPENALFRPISRAMTFVTGDSSLTYHHLRHSCITWLLIRLTGPRHAIYQVAPFLDHPEFLPDRLDELRNTLLGNEHLGRKGAYAVSDLCGHAELSTTFTNYIHLNDWLLAQELAAPADLPRLDIQSLVALAGLKRATFYKRRQGIEPVASEFPDDAKVMQDWAILIAAVAQFREPLRYPLLAQACAPNPCQVNFPSNSDQPSPLAQIKMVLVMSQHAKPIEDICRKTSLPEATIKGWLDIAKKFGSMSTKGKTFRHHRMATPNLFPLRPRNDADRKLAQIMLTEFDLLDTPGKNNTYQFIDYFIETFTIHNDMLIYRKSNKQLLKDHIDILLTLGISKSQLCLVTLDKNLSKDSIRQLKAEWNKALGIKLAWRTRDKNWSTKSLGPVGLDVRVAYGSDRGKKEQ